MFTYICRKDNPKIIKAFGNVDIGGLGSYNENIYQEVQDELPLGWLMEEPLPKKQQMWNAISQLPIALKIKYSSEISAINTFLEAQDYVTITQIFENISNDPELQSVIPQLVEILNE